MNIGLTPFDRDEGLVEGELYLQLLMDLDQNFSESSLPEEETDDDINFDLIPEPGLHVIAEAKDARPHAVREKTKLSFENLFVAADASQRHSPASPARGSPSAFSVPLIPVNLNQHLDL